MEKVDLYVRQLRQGVFTLVDGDLGVNGNPDLVMTMDEV